MIRGVVALAVLAIASCSPGIVVKGIAADDLDCPDDEIEVDGWGMYTAEGCGKRARYVCSQSGQGGGGCIQSGEVETIRPTSSKHSKRSRPQVKREPHPSARRISLVEAAKTLGRAATASHDCLVPDGPTGETHLEITFAPSGEATEVVLEEPYEGTSVGECIDKKFMRANVPPFDGDDVTIGKTFTP